MFKRNIISTVAASCVLILFFCVCIPCEKDRIEAAPEWSSSLTALATVLTPSEAHAAIPVAGAWPGGFVAKNQPTACTLSLDGLSSFDPDGDPLNYQWFGPFGTVQGSTPEVDVPEGT